ncbi:MAG: transposase [Bacteroidetes bacterium]|nr:transposase [Bacteroidota bacterium]
MTSLKVYLDTQTLSVVREAYPLIIELSHQGVKVKIDTPYPLPEKNFDYVQEKVVACRETLLSVEKITEINNYLSRELDELKSIINYFEGKNELYTAKDIISNYYRKETNGEFEAYVIRLIRMQKKRTGKVGIYSNLLKQIELYNRQIVPDNMINTPFRFENVTRLWVTDFYRYISNLHLSQSAKDSYMRTFKNICLSACKDSLLENDLFSKGRPAGVIQHSIDAHFSTNIISQLEKVDLKDDEALSLARDLFLFSYYADCMPFNKLATLKKSDIHEGVIWYRLYKGKRQLISIKITPALSRLINNYNMGGEYLFPLLKESIVDIEEQIRIQLLRYNRNLKKLSMLMGLNVILNSNSMLKISDKKDADNSIMISASFNGNMHSVKIACPEGCNVEELVLMNLKKIMGYNLTG